MTIRNPVVSQEVEQHLTARLPGWQHRVRVGKSGGRSVPVPCEVCGGEMRYRRSEIEGRQRRGMPLPRFCSRRCAMLARHRPAAEA